MSGHPSNPDYRDPYDLGPEPAPNPRSRPPIHIRVATLDYQKRDPNAQTGISTGGQFVIGLFFPYAYGFASAFVAAMLSSAGGIAALVGFIPVIAFIRWRTGWTAFVPGVLSGIFILPIVAFALCAGIIGGFGIVGGIIR